MFLAFILLYIFFFKKHARLMIEKILTHEYFFQSLVFAPQGSEQELSSSHVSSSNVSSLPPDCVDVVRCSRVLLPASYVRSTGLR